MYYLEVVYFSSKVISYWDSMKSYLLLVTSTRMLGYFDFLSSFLLITSDFVPIFQNDNLDFFFITSVKNK